MAASLTLVTFLFLFGGAISSTFDPYFPHHFSVAESEEDHKITGEDLVFIIRSQESMPHVAWALQLKQDIEQQYHILNLGNPTVILLHMRYEYSGTWTILPILTLLQEEFPDAKWLFFCEELSRVSAHGLMQVLAGYDPEEEWFLGHALLDKAATVIHHYRFHDDPSQFSYPDFEAGWAISSGLLRRLSERLQTEEQQMDFSIDVKHELAYYIWNEGNGTSLTHLPSLCAGNVEANPAPLSDNGIRNHLTTSGTRENDGCITAHPRGLPTCGKAVAKQNILFAVKTCEMYHKERVPIVKETWGQHTDDIIFVSDVLDPSIPTVESGVPNTDKGHCGKLFAIFEMFDSRPEYKHYPWLVVVDDDTILSVSRLRSVLSCYDPRNAVFVGERYGYGHLRLGWGYDYLTGGGGMVFSREGVSQLLATGCKCTQNDDPDDMMFGMCVKRHNFPIIHSPLFHQARPSDYAKALLDHQTPVSFHKHLNSDPIAVYQQWFREVDEADSFTHEEL